MGNAAGAGAGRLAVWEWEQHGERFAAGQWLVTDAERAAAGAETVATRSRRLLPANRERAARQYADGGLPAGAEAARVWFPRDAAALRERLGARQLTAWADDGVLHVLWRGEADRATLTGAVQASLWPVDGEPGLWEASLRVSRLAEAVITLMVLVTGAGDQPGGRLAGEELVFRGPRAPAAPPLAPLRGQVQEHTLSSAALGGPRGVTVYVPPDAAGGGPLPACVLADGASVAWFAPAVETAVRSGAVPPALLVGVHNASATGQPRRADLRALEYLPQLRSRRFAAHLDFVTGEVIPWAAGRYPVSPRPWIAAGYSNGAVWAITAAQRRPDLFGGVAAFSAGMVPGRVARNSREVRHYLAAGTLETGFRRSTSAWAARLERDGMACRYREWPGGHDNWWWQTELPAALGWLLAGG